MNLHDILRSKGRPVTVRPVSFHAVSLDENGAQVKAEVPAVLVALNELERAQVRQDADKELARRFKDQLIVESVRRDEEIYHLLHKALKDAEPNEAGSHSQLAESVAELRLSLVLLEARRLKEEYDRFMEDEFPERIDQETWNKLVEDAKKNSLPDLLTAYGYEKCRAVLRSLDGRSSR